VIRSPRRLDLPVPLGGESVMAMSPVSSFMSSVCGRSPGTGSADGPDLVTKATLRATGVQRCLDISANVSGFGGTQRVLSVAGELKRVDARLRIRRSHRAATSRPDPEQTNQAGSGVRLRRLPDQPMAPRQEP